jgi:hypothetical protein
LDVHAIHSTRTSLLDVDAIHRKREHVLYCVLREHPITSAYCVLPATGVAAVAGDGVEALARAPRS